MVYKFLRENSKQRVAKYKYLCGGFGMKSSVCGVCLKSGLLCKSCGEKVKNGEISEAEVKTAGILFRLSEKRKPLKDITIVKVAESPEMVVIVCGKGDAAKIIGASGKTVKILEKELENRVMIAEESGDMNDFIHNLLNPVPVVSISTLYRQGREIVKVVTGRFGGPRISSKDFGRAMKALYGKEAELLSE
jgi:transcription antitermination factor NusA-like protein